MVMTGTLDDSPLLGGTADQRLRIYDALTNAPHYLLVFQGGDHMVFSGGREAFGPAGLPGMKGDPRLDPSFQSGVRALCLAFFDAYLRNVPQAQTWLDGPAARSQLAPAAARWQHAPPAGKDKDE